MAVAFILACAIPALAQNGRVGGTIKDEGGQAIKGATVTAENADASPQNVTATTDDKGRFSIIGLRAGTWTITVQAPGYVPETGQMPVRAGGSNPPIAMMLKRGGGAPAAGALAGMTGKEIQADLAAADQAFNNQRWDEAISRYRALIAKAPALNLINLQIGTAYRNKQEYDNAIAAYNQVLRTDPNNEKAKIGVSLALLDKGDLQAADAMLTAAADTPNPSKDVLFNLAEVKFARGETDEAAKWYQRAADADPSWVKPLYKLALVTLNKGDKQAAARYFDRVIAADPTSFEAAQAKIAVEQIRR